MTPTAVATDAQGDVYLTDGNRVRKISPNGVISTVAGQPGSTWAFCGDGGPATSACLASPAGLAVDGNGDLYIADYGNNRVREVSPLGTISTIAGTGTAGFCGDGGPATSACLTFPVGLAIDSHGDLFIADSSNQRVREVTTAGTITTVAGNGTTAFCGDGGPATSACLNDPLGVAVDQVGDMYVGDTRNGRVREVSASGTITTVAGGASTAQGCGNGLVRPATSATIAPEGLALDGNGNLYSANPSTSEVCLVSPTGTITTFAGSSSLACPVTSPATSGCLDQPADETVDAQGNVYIADTGYGRIRRVDTTGNMTILAGSGGDCGDGGPATSACLGGPHGVTLDGQGDLFIADSSFVREVNVAGTISTAVGTGAGVDCFPLCPNRATGVAVDSQGNLYYADATDEVFERSPTGAGTLVAGQYYGGFGPEGFCGDGGPATSACLNHPEGLAIDGKGDLLIADSRNNRVREVSPSGIISTVVGNGIAGFCGDGGPAIAACLNGPTEIALDNQGDLFIADAYNGRVREVSPAGTIITVAGGGIGTGGYCGDGGPAALACLYLPFGVAVDAHGDLYIADYGENRVREVSPTAGVLLPTGTITTIAGNGTAGYCGDGGPASSACVSRPLWVAADSSGNVYVTDYGNDVIREVTAA